MTWDAAFKEVRNRLPDLLVRLEDAVDERAGACLAALSGKTWDLAAARPAVTGVRAGDDGGELGRLRRLAQLTAPAESDVREAAAALREAAAGLEAVAGSSAGRARALAALLTAALQHYEAHGDGDCPVCGRPGARQATEQEVARLGEEAQAVEAAERVGADVRQRALALVQPSPPAIRAWLRTGSASRHSKPLCSTPTVGGALSAERASGLSCRQLTFGR